MPKLSLPHWHTPEQVRDILLELPETKRNRALYELIWQFGHDNPQGIPESEAQLATLRLLWHDPRIQGLENIKLWLKEVLYSDEGNGSWLALQPEIETLLDVLHPETCGEYGEHGGMRRDAAQRGHTRTLCSPHDCPKHRKRPLHRPLLPLLERSPLPPAPRF